MIPLTPDREDMPRYMPPEHCCFCGRATRMWYAPRDVGVCTSCAETRDESEVPSKDAWCDSPQGRGYVPYPGTVVLHCMIAGRRTALHGNDDGTYQLYFDDEPYGEPMAHQEATAWLGRYLQAAAPPPAPPIGQRTGEVRHAWPEAGALRHA